jgi:hypothetical protein
MISARERVGTENLATLCDLSGLGPSGKATEIARRMAGTPVIAAAPTVTITRVNSAGNAVRAENPVHGSDQQSCLPGVPPVMITGHVPAVRLPPDHADDLMVAAVAA